MNVKAEICDPNIFLNVSFFLILPALQGLCVFSCVLFATRLGIWNYHST